VLEYSFQESIGYWIFMASRSWERAIQEELAPLGITHRQFQVLAWLAYAGDMTQRDLTERMHVEAPTLAGILDRMERDGWISRQGSVEDRRQKIVRATERANPVWTQIVDCLQRVRERATRGLSPRQVEQAMATLDAILRNLGEDEPSEAELPRAASRADRDTVVVGTRNKDKNTSRNTKPERSSRS
jgi:MarR family transcriptional regulator for hemolysin